MSLLLKCETWSAVLAQEVPHRYSLKVNGSFLFDNSFGHFYSSSVLGAGAVPPRCFCDLPNLRHRRQQWKVCIYMMWMGDSMVFIDSLRRPLADDDRPYVIQQKWPSNRERSYASSKTGSSEVCARLKGGFCALLTIVCSLFPHTASPSTQILLRPPWYLFISISIFIFSKKIIH